MPGGAAQPGGRHRFYHEVQLRGPVPQRLLAQPSHPANAPTALIEAVRNAARDPEGFSTSPALRPMFDSFGWLPLLASGEPADTSAAQALAAVWLERHGRYTPRHWTPGLTAARARALLHHMRILTEGRDAPWREALLDSLARQARHLRRVARRAGDRHDNALAVNVIRAMASLCLPEDRGIGDPLSGELQDVLTRMAAGELPRHWRNPDEALQDLRDLTALAQVYGARRLTPPRPVSDALKVARLAVGGLMDAPDRFAALPGFRRGDAVALRALALPRRDEAGMLLAQLGLGRFSLGELTLCYDEGRKTDSFGAGAFTLSEGGYQIITNCGAPSVTAAALIPRMGKWREVLLAPPAASTLDQLAHHTCHASFDRSEEGALLTLDRAAPGEYHRRRLFLDTITGQLRGEDAAQLAQGLPVYRFHLAPGTEVSLEAAAPTPTAHLSIAPGRVWRFTTANANLRVEESIDATEDGKVVETLQLVLRPERPGVRWAVIKG